MSKTKRMRRIKQEIGYEASPPLCRNCCHWHRRFREAETMVLREAHCTRFHFGSPEWAVCDEWESKYGERIADYEERADLRKRPAAPVEQPCA